MNKIDKFLNENIFMDGFNLFEEVKTTDVLQEIRTNENIVNQLLEKKGVAMYNFKYEIQEIVDYILKVFHSKYKYVKFENGSVGILNKLYNCSVGQEISFQIPKQLTKKISFIRNLKINVVILCINNVDMDEKTKSTASIQSFANLKSSRNLNLFKNKLKSGDVTCGVIAFDGVLKPETISMKLYHELGHYFQDFNLEKNKNSLFKQTQKDSYYKHRDIFMSSKNPYIVKIGKIFYALFNKTELSQHSTGIYAELVELNPNLNNINNAIKLTTTYNWYKELSEFVSELESYSGVDIWEAAKKFYITKSHPNGFENITGLSFRDKFIKLSVKNLNTFYRKMMNAVELYIEEKNQ